MAKICPQCQKENPNAANVCMFCGTRLVEDAELDELDKLHKELHEVKKDLQFYKKSFEDANSKIVELGKSKVSTENNIVKKFEEQLDAEKKQNNNLIRQLNAVKNRKSRWAWFFFLLCVILSFLFVAVISNAYREIENKKNRISGLEHDVMQIKNENKKLVDLQVDNETLNRLKQENQKLSAENEKFQIQISQLNNNQQVITNNNSDNNVSNKSTSNYRAITNAYFYDYENGRFTQRNAYLVANDVVNITMQISGYGYTEFVNHEGKTSKGWLKMLDLSKN